jgi:glycosyltransferase involved in cell wall biosynthesis
MYRKSFLAGKEVNTVHNNFNVIRLLNKINPEVVIIMGYYPTMMYCYLWTLFKVRKLIVFTDGTLLSESSLTFMHRLVRWIVFKRANSFIGPSKGSADLYQSYGIEKERFFRTYLAVDNSKFANATFEQRKYDIMFSGQFIDRKMPFFFVEIARILKEKNKMCTVLMLGDGPLRSKVIELLNRYEIVYDCPGFIQQKELPAYYAQAKLLLFPSKNDPWGVVANEAMAAGLPVLTCEAAGVAHDLVRSGENGYVLPLIARQWADTADRLLSDPDLYEEISANAKRIVQEYNFDNAAQGIIDAIQFTRQN